MRLAQVAQRATDLDRAAAFYADLLGSTPTGRFNSPGMVFFDLDGTRLLLEAGVSSATLYFQVESVRERIEQLRAAGVPIESEPHVIFRHQDDALGPAGTDEWMGFVRDPDDNLVGLVSHEPSA
jgi:methylmalonyl-CoA/ethylmalonyl-CoA epimerase